MEKAELAAGGAAPGSTLGGVGAAGAGAAAVGSADGAGVHALTEVEVLAGVAQLMECPRVPGAPCKRECGKRCLPQLRERAQELAWEWFASQPHHEAEDDVAVNLQELRVQAAMFLINRHRPARYSASSEDLVSCFEKHAKRAWTLVKGHFGDLALVKVLLPSDAVMKTRLMKDAPSGQPWTLVSLDVHALVREGTRLIRERKHQNAVDRARQRVKKIFTKLSSCDAFAERIQKSARLARRAYLAKLNADADADVGTELKCAICACILVSGRVPLCFLWEREG